MTEPIPAIPYKSARSLEERVTYLEKEARRMQMVLTGAVAMILSLCGIIVYKMWSKQW